jgi:hypothetical protein
MVKHCLSLIGKNKVACEAFCRAPPIPWISTKMNCYSSHNYKLSTDAEHKNLYNNELSTLYKL